ncbi:MAG: hypothetical protein IPL58_15705 [Betaproteobacteria bacterium]|uniref:Uncharacterized protein n=1 Tax=Candidatus Proximibacter danicus TaxID=2954365 RepID=A0A9D7K699_9PROT|nr:hypothetical protein [Candidatus Proximibacter danicus]
MRIYGYRQKCGVAPWNFKPGLARSRGRYLCHGDNKENHQPLNSIEPLRLSMGIARDAGSWGREARLRAATTQVTHRR